MSAHANTGTVLDRILESRRAWVEHRKRVMPETVLKFGVQAASPVRDFAAALANGEVRAAGALMLESHESLRRDYEVSTPALDDRVLALAATKGVYGARLTGAGLGGCVVVLADRAATIKGWRLFPVAG